MPVKQNASDRITGKGVASIILSLWLVKVICICDEIQ